MIQVNKGKNAGRWKTVWRVCEIPVQRTIYSVRGLNCKTAACCQAFLLIRKIIYGKETHAAEGLVTALLG